MTAPPRVSIITIFLNAEPYLAEAIDSVLVQEYSDWELILVNDGSTDASGAIANDYAARHPTRIRYIEHPGGENRGMSASRNLGMRHARAELIAMLDADDAWLPGFLARQVAELDAHPEAAMVFGPVERWYDWRTRATDAAPATAPTGIVHRPLGGYDRLVEPPELVRHMLKTRYGVPLGVLMRTRAVEAVGGYVERFTGLCEDMAFFSKFCLAHPVYLTADCGYRYRQHAESSVRVASREGRAARIRLAYLRWFAQHCRAVGARDSRVWWWIGSEMLRFSGIVVYKRVRSLVGAAVRRDGSRRSQASTVSAGGATEAR
jgi:glycosyltransferase involved in cell wall biosynthesis